MGAVLKLQASVIHRHLISIIIIMDTKIIFCLLLAVVITSALPAAEMNEDFTKLAVSDDSSKPSDTPTDKPTGPTEKPTGPTDKPTGSTDKPTGSTDKPTGPTTTTPSGSTTINFSLTTLIVAVLMRNML